MLRRHIRQRQTAGRPASCQGKPFPVARPHFSRQAKASECSANRREVSLGSQGSPVAHQKNRPVAESSTLWVLWVYKGKTGHGQKPIFNLETNHAVATPSTPGLLNMGLGNSPIRETPLQGNDPSQQNKAKTTTSPNGHLPVLHSLRTFVCRAKATCLREMTLYVEPGRRIEGPPPKWKTVSQSAGLTCNHDKLPASQLRTSATLPHRSPAEKRKRSS